ncbi:hypothetical protein HU200_007568 [Digitaria exilis]|uniref:Uncharacterized protein n=1 Tax=Digitaria exilis TaxID=1010633 RepID=A0A835FMG9_9POAL|nr:hypothetical protein HU200_007568 [Digitaria exilis]
MAHKEQRAGAPTLSPPPRLRVLDTTLVPPSPSGSPPPECSLPLTIYDTFWLPFPPVERLFLYRLTPDADVQAILSNLKLALSRAIHAFYPLAGRIRLTPGTSDRYELHYRPGDGVIFTVAEYDGGLATDDPRAIAPLVPALPAGGAAVLALQATLLPAHRRGLAVGVAVNHAAVDGSASTHFLHSWAAAAAACAHTNSPPAPVIDRSLLPVALFQPMPTINKMEFDMPAGQLLATFTLYREDIQRVKDAVAAEAARRGVAPPPRCTSLVSTLGFVWSCHHHTRSEHGRRRPDLLALLHRPPLADEPSAPRQVPRQLRRPSARRGTQGRARRRRPAQRVRRGHGGHRRGGERRQDGQHGRVDGPLEGGRRRDEHAARGRLTEVPRLRDGPGLRPAGEGGHRVRGEDRRAGGGGEPPRRRRDGGGCPSAAGRHGALPYMLRRCYRGAARAQRYELID